MAIIVVAAGMALAWHVSMQVPSAAIPQQANTGARPIPPPRRNSPSTLSAPCSWTQIIRETPLRVALRRQPVIEVPNGSLDQLLAKLTGERLSAQSRVAVTASSALHVLRLHGSGATMPIASSMDEFPVTEVLLDSHLAEKVFGGRIVYIGRHGVRYQWPSGFYPVKRSVSEVHYAQILAGLAEAGVASSARIVIGIQTFPLRDAVGSMMLTFDFRRHEFEWTALALALYLSPPAVWHNRFGEKCSIDDLAHRLAAVETMGHSCGGTHLLYAMAVLSRVDELEPVLSRGVRLELAAAIAALVLRVESSQMEDGGWSKEWNRGPSARRREGESDLLITGHIAEAMLLLPETVAIHPDRMRRAAGWLLMKLQQLQSDELFDNFCPITHAICALRQMSNRVTVSEAHLQKR